MIFIRMKYGTQTAGYFGVKRIRKPPVVGQVIEVKPRRGFAPRHKVERFSDGPWQSFRITQIKDLGYELLYFGEHW